MEHTEAKALEPWQGRIERLGWGGLGLSRLEDGRAVLLSSALALFPGERVSAAVAQHARHCEGRVERWLQSDPRRVQPACPVAQSCGGCGLWGSGAARAELKRLQIEDLLSRQLRWDGAWDWISPGPAEAELALRRRIQLHWDGARLGYHQPGSHRIVEIEACPAAAPELSAAVPALRSALQQRALPRGLARWELACGSPVRDVLAYRLPAAAAMAAAQAADPEDSASAGPPAPVWSLRSNGRWAESQAPLVHELGAVRLIQPPGAFFQVCPPWAWQGFSRIFSSWELGGASLYDIYSGVGFFSRMLAADFQNFRLLEGSALACSALPRNLDGLDYRLRQQDAATWDARGPQAADTVLLDPPRAGLPGRLSRALLDCRAGSLVLVGCDGASFCRDIQRLSAGWELRSLAVLDLFPMTWQAEFIGLLRQRRRA
ncbi:class I SAM-dependent RNA methyltransferase [bacterium]|nr:class I SAM-dependent RNA methyltransferase [bacterium]